MFINALPIHLALTALPRRRQENIEFRFTMGLTSLVRRFLGSAGSRVTMLGFVEPVSGRLLRQWLSPALACVGAVRRGDGWHRGWGSVLGGACEWSHRPRMVWGCCDRAMRV